MHQSLAGQHDPHILIAHSEGGPEMPSQWKEQRRGVLFLVQHRVQRMFHRTRTRQYQTGCSGDHIAQTTTIFKMDEQALERKKKKVRFSTG
jgi:hypothetical protein